jgi:L-lactate dehydrogenase complex protein LldG
MSDARTDILRRIRQRRREVERPPASARGRGPLPQWTDAPVDRFMQRAAMMASTVACVSGGEAVPVAIAQYLRALGVPATGACWPELAALSWAAAGIDLEARPARAVDAIGVTGVFCAIAETGTLVLASGPDTPASVSLLPETHIAVVPQAAVVRTMEDAWDRLRAARALPRAVNLVSGPSRTADIEQTVTLGAHGPARLHIIVLTD